MAAALEKHVVEEQLKKSASVDRDSNNSPANNGVDSTGHSRDGTPVDHRRSPSTATQDAAKTLVQMSNTPPLSKQNSQSPKSKPSTPTSVQKRGGSVDELSDKLNSLTTSKNKSSDQQNLLSNRDEALTCHVNNKKRSGRFRIDPEYLPVDKEDHQDLEMWQPDPDIPYDSVDAAAAVNRGKWSVDEMFRANEQLGVHSTYNGIDEYSTTVPDGNEEDIRRANELAMEIENNNESQKNRLLENDDEERDLDKETRFNSDRDGGRGQKRQSGGGYPNKNPRSQYNGGSGNLSNEGRTYSNSPRNSYPNTGSGSSTGSSNRYNGPQPRQQRGPYSSSNFSGSNPSGRQGGAPTATSWRTESPQQPQQLASVQPSNPAYAKPKSPSLHSEERRQSASPATSKYSTDSSTSIRRTNSVQNRQQQVQAPNYSPHPDAYQQQTDKRVPDNRYYPDNTSSASIPPTASPQTHSQIEMQPIITPIPRQATTPQSQVSGSYDPHQHYDHSHEGGNNEDSDKSKKKFTFNPDAAIFVPKVGPKTTPTPVATPSTIPMQVGIPQQAQSISIPNYNGHPQMMQILPMGMQQPLILAQQSMGQQVQPNMQHVPQQRLYTIDGVNYVDNGKLMENAQLQQQQKYMAPMQLPQRMLATQPMQYQYVPQNQYQNMVSQQMQINTITHPQITGQIPYANSQTGISYQQAPPMVHQQSLIYPSNYAYGGAQ